MADQLINLQVKVNAETGELEVLGAKLSAAGKGATEAKSAFSGLKGEAEGLAKSFLPFLTAGGILAFFTSAVKAAEDENQSLQRLRFTVEATGGSWATSQKQAQAWGAQIAANTRFSDGEAFDALDKLTRATGNMTQAQKASQVAMGISVQTGKPLNESIQLMQGLLSGNARAVMEVRREFGAFAGDAQTAQQALDALSGKFGDAAFKEDSFTKTTDGLKNAFDEFKEEVGRGLIPALTPVIGLLSMIIRGFRELGTVAAAGAATFIVAAEAMGKAAMAIAHLDFKGAKLAMSNLGKEIVTIEEETANAVDEIEAEHQKKSVDRIVEKQRLKARAGPKDVAAAEEEAKKLAQIDAELNQKMASIGDQTFAKKRAMLAAEIAAQRTKINTELKLEKDKHTAILKLNALEAKATAQLNKDEVKYKTEAALQITDLALQTLSILNGLGEGHNKNEVRRAKAILALQQAIAIARVWAAEASKGAIGLGIAAASTGLIIAQFAQQSRAIDRAAESQNPSISSAVPGGPGTAAPLESVNAPAGTLPVSGAPGAGAAQQAGGAAGAGGAGQVFITVGPITINLTVDSLEIADRAAVLRALGDEIRKETVAAAQFARSTVALAEKRSAQAV